MKRKLCPFDKSECIGESCTLFSEKKEVCGLVLLCSPAGIPVKNESPRPSGDEEYGGHERKSRFKAELFD
ncbi:MAG: hypothetical protein WCP36_04480 [Methanomicrobiales archaeon]